MVSIASATRLPSETLRKESEPKTAVNEDDGNDSSHLYHRIEEGKTPRKHTDRTGKEAR